jgi:hypothetical protein
VVTGLKHQKEKRSMEHFAGLDVSVNETSVCTVMTLGDTVLWLLMFCMFFFMVAIFESLWRAIVADRHPDRIHQ